jgi:hypothetical protein
MWLRDSLPDDLPGARILIYGYDTELQKSQSFQSLRNLANQFRNDLRAIRGKATVSGMNIRCSICWPFLGRSRPQTTDIYRSQPWWGTHKAGIIPSHHLVRNLFITQPQALIQMKNGNDEDQDNLKATYGALFFGVPNQGMDISSLIPMVGDQPNRYLLESLGPESDVLQEQRATFPKVFDFRDSEIVSFFETKLSPTALQVSLIKPFSS